MKPEPDATVDTVKAFWESHVNNEYYTEASRASDQYFSDIEERRYRAHYNLVDLFAKLAGSEGKLLEFDDPLKVRPVTWLAPPQAPKQRVAAGQRPPFLKLTPQASSTSGGLLVGGTF